MKKEFITNNAKFVYSVKELGYQEVLDNFSEATEIIIVTYNISARHKILVSALEKAKEHSNITIITNIPDRWETYYNDSFRKRAQDKINIYLKKLSSDSLGINTSVFFNFSNHGKIIMTDSMVYIGSANYSEESANNIEFGMISCDRELISFIKSSILPDIQSSSVPYYEYDYTSLLLEANLALSAVYNVKNDFNDETHCFHDDIDGEFYYYNRFEANLKELTLDTIIDIVSEACKVANEILDAIYIITDGDDDETTAVMDLCDSLKSLSSKIEELAYADSLRDLARFDHNEFINNQFQDKYAMEAYEENLENCIDLASGEAMDAVCDITNNAEDDVEKLINEIQLFCEKYAVLIDNLRQREIRKINSTINNT